MIASRSLTAAEPRWKTYAKAGVFLLPAASLWFFAHQFLQPKLEFFWRFLGHGIGNVQWAMNTSTIIMRSGGLALVAVALILLLTEMRFSAYRRGIVAATVFFLNSAVVVGLATMAISFSLVVMPGRALLSGAKPSPVPAVTAPQAPL